MQGFIRGRKVWLKFVVSGEIGMHSHAGAWEREETIYGLYFTMFVENLLLSSYIDDNLKREFYLE